MQVIREFIEKLLPVCWSLDNTILVDPTHRIDISELPNRNIKFAYSSAIGTEWHLMTTIEVETGKHFWIRVVEAVRCFTGATFLLPDKLVATLAQSLPGAELLTQERAREGAEVRLPSSPRAGASNPDFEGTIKSRGSTKTRPKEDDNEEDVMDNLHPGE